MINKRNASPIKKGMNLSLMKVRRFLKKFCRPLPLTAVAAGCAKVSKGNMMRLSAIRKIRFIWVKYNVSLP